MRFNNLLNRLRIKRIYALIAGGILLFLALFILLIKMFFYVAPPEEVFSGYLAALREGRYNDALRVIVPEQQEAWQKEFKELTQDESALASISSLLRSEASAELVSKSTAEDNRYALRFQLSLADSEKIFQSVRHDAEAGLIDMSDPDVVRVSKDPESTLLYYVEDNFKDYQKFKEQKQVIINFRLLGNVWNRSWAIEADEDLLELLAGNPEAAYRKVFAAPLNLPKH